MVSVTVKLFGPLRDIVARDELTLDIPNPHDGNAAFDLLARGTPQLTAWRSSVRLAVNLEYAAFDRVLQSGDEVCFIPPVSGG